jgi:uncharacterized protein
MVYATGRVRYDADSHVMELGGFLDDYLDPDLRNRLRPPPADAAGVYEKARRAAEVRHGDPVAAAAGEARLMKDKGWMALGAFDPTERSRALDLLGFDAQLVFSTFSSLQFLGRDLERLYGGARAHNRAMAAFCSHDDRLLPVGYVPLPDPARAVSLAAEAIDEGCRAIMVPSTAAGERAPTHPDLDGFWALLADADVPFVLHVGGGGRLLDPAFHNNAMPVTDHLGGGENVRSKDYLAIHHSPALFLGTLVLDGLFDRFPALRGGCIEQGAGWVVSWLHHLDNAARAFARTEPPLQRLQLRPSEYVHRHLKFTPFPGEPVGSMINQAGADLFMFSSDYPHPEGSRDPVGKFEQTLTGIDEADKERFYATNFAELLSVDPTMVSP